MVRSSILIDEGKKDFEVDVETVMKTCVITEAETMILSPQSWDAKNC